MFRRKRKTEAEPEQHQAELNEVSREVERELAEDHELLTDTVKRTADSLRRLDLLRRELRLIRREHG